jgi:hypothetical protein
MTNTQPSGYTPLTKHINQIHPTIQGMKHSLESLGKRIVIVLATDGLPTDSRGNTNAVAKKQFVKSLKRLEGLPVWLVIRLSTDEDKVLVSTRTCTSRG